MYKKIPYLNKTGILCLFYKKRQCILFSLFLLNCPELTWPRLGLQSCIMYTHTGHWGCFIWSRQMLLQQGGAMNVQLPQVGSVQQTTSLTNQVQQTTINPIQSGTQQLTIQQQAPAPQQSLQQQTNTLTQVGQTLSRTHSQTHKNTHTRTNTHIGILLSLCQFRSEQNVPTVCCMICKLCMMDFQYDHLSSSDKLAIFVTCCLKSAKFKVPFNQYCWSHLCGDCLKIKRQYCFVEM